MLKLYNSLGRKVEPFKPIKEGEVKMYCCGPTVWNYATIGNFRTFVFEDVLRRYLKFKGFKVYQVKNITDVEDRIIKGIKQSKMSRAELTSFYEKAFREDSATLGIEPADLYPRATENLKEMEDLVNRLIDKGYGYKAQDGSVYFDVSKFKAYGALSGVRLGSGKSAGRVSEDHYEDKQEATDFALWKAWDPADGDVYWENSLGKGRPGWSIECSSMSMKYLGETFDIHTGGMDLKFPHHENEIAQSEAATGKKFVNYWIHSDFLKTRGEEMHKSVGNVVYVRDLVKAGWSPQTIRMFLVSSSYRDPLDLTDTSLEQARAQTTRLSEFVARLKSADSKSDQGSGLSKALVADFEGAMDDDLNTPKAFSILFTFVKRMNTLIDSDSISSTTAAESMLALKKVDSVLRVVDFAEDQTLEPELATLLAQRDGARKRRDFHESDRLRKELLSRGVEVEDTPKGTRWKRVGHG